MLSGATRVGGGAGGGAEVTEAAGAVRLVTFGTGGVTRVITVTAATVVIPLGLREVLPD